MNLYSIISGFMAILSAVLTFILDIAEVRDKRKKFLGTTTKTLKKYCAYITLCFTLLTFILQSNHDFQEKTAQLKKDRTADSLQRANLDTTLKSIQKTLVKQQETLDSTNTVLERQKKEMEYQVIMLNKQNIFLLNNGKLLYGQKVELENLRDILTKQNATLDSNSKIITGQNFQLENLADILYATDPVHNSTIELSLSYDTSTWMKTEYNDVIRNYRAASVYSSCAFHSGEKISFIDDCLKKHENVSTVSLFFFNRNLTERKIEELFHEETTNLIRNDISLIKNRDFKFLCPTFSIESNEIKKGVITIDTSSNEKTEFSFHGGISFTSKIYSGENKKFSFSELNNRACLLVINCLYTGQNLSGLSFWNNDFRKSFSPWQLRQIFKRRIPYGYFARTVYQYVYLCKFPDIEYH